MSLHFYLKITIIQNSHNSDFMDETHPMSMVDWIWMESFQRQSMGKL